MGSKVVGVIGLITVPVPVVCDLALRKFMAYAGLNDTALSLMFDAVFGLLGLMILRGSWRRLRRERGA